jgi:hypothetical protein
MNSGHKRFPRCLEHRNLSNGLVAVITPDAIFSVASGSSHVTIFFRELDRFGYTAHADRR